LPFARLVDEVVRRIQRENGDERRAPPRSSASSLGARSYSIAVGRTCWARPRAIEDAAARQRRVIVSNETVAPLYGDACRRARCSLSEGQTSSCADGEGHKTWQTLQTIFDAMLARIAIASTTVFALGGGVVGDLAASPPPATCAGVGYVQVPTTLLAQVDSSVGGKTGVNHPSAKNMIGAFHQPLAVIADVDVLETLPDRELVAGLAEVIKYGAVADDAFLGWIETSLPALLARDKSSLAQAVTRSCHIKAEIVATTSARRGCARFSTSATPSPMRSRPAPATAPGFTARPSAAAWRWRPTSPRVSA
jgi:3-dehydroquinate synthase